MTCTKDLVLCHIIIMGSKVVSFSSKVTHECGLLNFLHLHLGKFLIMENALKHNIDGLSHLSLNVILKAHVLPIIV